MGKAALGLAMGLLTMSAGASASGTDSGKSSNVSGQHARKNALTLPRLACDWSPGDNTPTESTPPGSIRYGWVDLSAGYWQMLLSPSFPVGTRFRLEGQYPDARYFSYQLYAGNVTNLAQFTDYQIVPDPGNLSPFTGPTTLNRSILFGGHYTIYLVFGPKPANPAPNTAYIDKSQFTSKQQAVFGYRIYNNFDGLTVAQTGGVPLPTVVEETSNGDVPLANIQTPALCNLGLNGRNNERLLVASLLDRFQALPQHPNPIPAQPVPPAPVFSLYQEDASTWLINRDNRYLYTQVSQRLGDLVLFRAKAPSFTTQPGAGPEPQLRHWSMCENSSVSVETYSCIEDEDAAIDAGGFFNIVMSVPTKRPSNADHVHGFDWMDWGTTYSAMPIFRHMIASPNFTQSAFSVPVGGDPATIMGDYYPLATYCANSVFSAHTNAGETPAQVFAACQVGQ
jgi:hypothetical protein